MPLLGLLLEDLPVFICILFVLHMLEKFWLVHYYYCDLSFGKVIVPLDPGMFVVDVKFPLAFGIVVCILLLVLCIVELGFGVGV